MQVIIAAMMSTSADDSCFSAAQSRRFACDRCHQHKLRCERSPIMVNGGVAIPLGSCKRCMKAQVPCQIIASSNTSHTNSSSKRKVSPIEAEKTNERVSVTVSSVPFSSSATESVSYATSPGDRSMFSTDTASLLGLDSFGIGTGDFTGLDTTASPTSILVWPPIGSASDNDTLAAKDVQNTPDAGIPEAQYKGFVDLTLFGAATPRPGGSASTVSSDPLSSHTTSSALVSQSESPPATRDNCRKRILELHSTIFNELHCITKADLADALFSGDCTSLANPEGGFRGNSIVSKLLSASERLIELLGMLRVAFASQPGHCDRSASALTRGSPITSSPRFNKHSASSSSSSSLLRQSVRPALPTAGSSSDASSPSSSPSSSPTSVDLPIIISFLTCYVGILAIYRAVLTHILLSLRSPEQQPRIQSRGGSVLSRAASSRGSGDTGTGGTFGMLGGSGSSSLQQVLRMRIQMEVLTHMIERIEDAWVAAMMDGSGSDEDEQLHHHHHHHHHHHQRQQQQQGEIGQGVGSGVLFGRAGTMELLQNMLVHEGFTWGDEGWRVGQGSLMRLLKRIRRLLRDSNFV
jgi:Fungal Zn(2)-Cys(6) binuclear cluster domain